MLPDTKVQATHVNAFKAELAEKQAQYNALGEEVAALKARIKEMESPAAEELSEEEQRRADLLKLTRAKLNAKAKEAGVEKPEDLQNKDAVVDAMDAAEVTAAGDDEAAEAENESDKADEEPENAVDEAASGNDSAAGNA
jgi:DNA repair ATPase RecN